jgi:hypothetical protein
MLFSVISKLSSVVTGTGLSRSIAVPENDDFGGERKKTSEPGAKGA